ncbi:MAG: GNAT family N-acetyltransferase [Propionibacteriaceae bacterium]|jgi:GNAT superfamily N-acetyltransferase|nr:GNAT family N-acetyltransferase [Propionibacteriaceae bacterium]
MDIIQATADDIEALIQLRLDFINDFHPHDADDLDLFREQLATFFPPRIASGQIVGVLGYEDGRVVSGALLDVADVPADCARPHGKRATLFCVHTDSAWRKRGFGAQIVAEAINICRELGLDCIDLEASNAGQGVYAAAGFVVGDCLPMRLAL